VLLLLEHWIGKNNLISREPHTTGLIISAIIIRALDRQKQLDQSRATYNIGFGCHFAEEHVLRRETTG